MGFVYFLIGVVVASGGWYFVARNNKKKFMKALDFDPKQTAKDIKKRLGWD